jgi:hypothetical protein
MCLLYLVGAPGRAALTANRIGLRRCTVAAARSQPRGLGAKLCCDACAARFLPPRPATTTGALLEQTRVTNPGRQVGDGSSCGGEHGMHDGQTERADLRLRADLITAGKYVFDDRDAWSEHQPSAQQENDYIERHGIAECARWHLGSTTSKTRTEGPLQVPVWRLSERPPLRAVGSGTQCRTTHVLRHRTGSGTRLAALLEYAPPW